VFAQDPCTPLFTYTVKNVYCINDGAIDIKVSNESSFTSIYYWVQKNGDTEPYNPVNSTSSVITGLIPGTYTLNIVTVSNDVSCGTQAKTTTVTDIVVDTDVRGVTPFSAVYLQSQSRLTSLNTFQTGQIVVNMSGGSGKYIVKIENCPAAYTGQKVFYVASAGNYTIQNLAPSTSQTYRISISDGCESVVVDAIQILPVKNDMPDYDYSMYVYYMEKDAFPYNNYYDLRIAAFVNAYNNQGKSTVNNDGTINTNDYFNPAVGPEFYEMAFSYGNSYSAIPESDWIPFSTSTLTFQGNQYYSYVSKAANQVSGRAFPYVFLRLKNAPTPVYKIFTNLEIQGGNYIPRLEITPTNSGLKLKVPYLRNQPITLPYTFRAVKKSSPGAGTIVSSTITVPSDGNYAIIPELDLDWSSGTWEIYIVGAAGGDTGLSIYMQDLVVGTKAEFFSNVSWAIYKQMYFACGSTFGNQRVYVNISIPSVSPASVIFSQIKINRNPLQNTFLPAEYTITGNTCNLTSDTDDGKDSGYKDVAAGTYDWTATVYDDQGNSVYTKALSTTIYDAGDIATVNDFGVTQKASDLCYGRKVVLKQSELNDIVKWTKADGTVVPGRATIRFYKITRDRYGNPSYSENVQISTSNFTFPTGGDSGSARIFTLKNLAAATSIENVEFNITESGDYAIVVVPSFGSEDIPGFGINGGSYTWSFGDGANPSCHKMNVFTIAENDMSTVKLDESSSGAFRCRTDAAGQFTINVTSSQPSTVDLIYTITATDAAGNPLTSMGNPVIDQVQKQARTHTITNIPPGVNYLKLEVATTTCLMAPATYIVQVYNLSSSTLLSYKGGILCQDGQSSGVAEDLILRAVNLPGTSYQWYYEDGATSVAIPNGNSNIVTIPAASFTAGTYRCDLTNTTCGTNIIYPHYLNVTADGTSTLYWSVDAINTNWNYMGNWRTADGDVSTYIPNKCTDVVIPGKVNEGAFFPYLTISSTGNQCRDIIFRYGAQLYHSERLDYDKAIIEYNLGYYGNPMPSDDTPSQPLLNADLGMQAGGEITGSLANMSRNRWWMIAAPLKDMVTGDFQMEGKPFVYNALYNKTINTPSSYVVKPTATSNESISIIGDNNYSLNHASNHNAMLLWVPAYTSATGGTQEALEDAKGKIVCSAQGTSINKYNMQTLVTTGASTITRSAAAGRFVYEDTSGNPGTSYYVQVAADINRTDGLVMIGNPFMGALNISFFYAQNSSLIDDYFKILTPSGWEEYNSTSLPCVAPLQGFVIRLKDPATAAPILFNFSMFVQEAVGRDVRPK